MGYTPVVPRIDRGRNIISLRSAQATWQDCVKKKKKEIKIQTDKNKQQRYFWSKQNPVNIREPQFSLLQLDLTSLCQFTLGAKGDSGHFSVLTKQGVLSLFAWVERCLPVWLWAKPAVTPLLWKVCRAQWTPVSLVKLLIGTVEKRGKDRFWPWPTEPQKTTCNKIWATMCVCLILTSYVKQSSVWCRSSPEPVLSST